MRFETSYTVANAMTTSLALLLFCSADMIHSMALDG